MAHYFEDNVDLRELLELLKADDDPIVVHQHVLQLQSQLSRSEDKSLAEFPLQGYINRLLEILGHIVIMDFQIDTKFSILSSFYFLMDIFPNTIPQMVKEGLVTNACAVIQENIAYTDLAERAVQLFIKISQETPVEVLDSPAVPTLLQVNDFCDSVTQKKIMQLCQNVSLHSQTEEHYNERALPIIEWLQPRLGVTPDPGNEKAAETVANTVLNVVSSLSNFYTPSKDFDKYAAQFEKLVSNGLISMIVQVVRDFAMSVQAARAKEAAQAASAQGQSDLEADDVAMDGNLIIISTGSAGDQPSLTDETVLSLLSILNMGAKYSEPTIQAIVNGGALPSLVILLPSEDQEQPLYVSELVSILNLVFPRTLADQENQKQVIVWGPRQIYPRSEEPDSQYQLLSRAIEGLDAKKQKIYDSIEGGFFEFCASTLLSKMLQLYRKNVGPQFRERCISIIDKVLAVLPNEVVHDRIDPYSLARLVLLVIQSGNGQQVLVCLQISKRALTSNALKFFIPFQREGASQAISDLNDAASLDKYDVEGDPSKASNPFAHPAGRIFGVGLGATRNEIKEILRLETDKIRSVLQLSEALIPPSKRDMLSVALREKELQLQLLEEKDASERKAEEANKEAAASEEMKDEESKDAAVAKGEEKKEEIPKLSEMIRKLSCSLVSDFLKNQALLKQVNDEHGDELSAVAKLKTLADEILDEAASQTFDCAKTQQLMSQLTQLLVGSHGITTFEFSRSGLLLALEIFLTKSPSQALIEREVIRNGAKREEVKHSEELIISAAEKQASRHISQKEAKCLILRVKVAAHAFAIDQGSKMPMRELVRQCQGIISNNESILFERTHERQVAQDSQEAIRQLNRREMIKVVYDPDGSLMEKALRKQQEGKQPADSKEEGAEATNAAAAQEEVLDEPMLNRKTKSVMLPFEHIKAGAAAPQGRSEWEEQSQVYLKRDRLFQVLGHINVDVIHGENLWTLQERLKKVDTLQKAKDYSQADRGSFKAVMRSSEEKEALMDKFNEFANDEVHSMLDRMSNRMDQLLDEAHSKQHFMLLSPAFVDEYAPEIVNMACEEKLSQEQVEQFFGMAMIDMEEKIHEHELGGVANEDEHLEYLRPDHQKHVMVEKIKAFTHMIRMTQDRTLKLYAERKPSELPPQVEEEKKGNNEDAPMSNEGGESWEPAEGTQAKTKAVFAEPPKIKTQDSVLSEQEAAQSASEVPEVPPGDVEMVDESKENSEVPKDEVLEAASPSDPLDDAVMADDAKKKAEKVKKPADEHHVMDTLDLHELIHRNNGQDCELQFFFNGKALGQNTCFYEVNQMYNQEMKKRQKSTPQPKYDKENPGAFFKQLMTTLSRHDPADQMPLTVYFRLIDNQASKGHRSDSLIDYISRRERTQSQAADLVSVKSLNHVVQHLIDSEFSVFQRSSIERLQARGKSLGKKTGSGEDDSAQLEQALKVLKVLHFMTRNTFLLSQEGIDFLLSRSSSASELSALTCPELNLAQALHGMQNCFHHSKLDINMLKSIQDPHKLVTGGLTGILKEIMVSCSFLFNYETKLLYFKLVSSLGVDINRTLAYLKHYLQKKGQGRVVSFIQEERGQNSNDAGLQKEEIDKENVLGESKAILERLEKRKQLVVQFKGEVGTGLGPTYHFYTLLSEGIKTALGGAMWRSGHKDGTLYPRPVDSRRMDAGQVKELSEVFRLAGTFLAKSIADNKLIDLPISSLMWDLLLDKKLNLVDFREYDATQFKLLCELQSVANKKREIDEMAAEQEAKTRMLQGVRTGSGTRLEDLGLYFTLPGYEEIELVRDGANTPVTLDNVQEYIDLVLHSVFYDCVSLQVQAFKKGFNFVMPIDALRSFSTKSEIEAMVCGDVMNDTEWQDVAKLQEAIKADHGYTAKSRCYKDFLRFIAEMEPAMRPQFIQWLTGSKRLPRGGFGSLENAVSINKVAEHTLSALPDQVLPSVNTCLHYVKFPEYSSYEVLKKKFEQAILLGGGAFLLN